MLRGSDLRREGLPILDRIVDKVRLERIKVSTPKFTLQIQESLEPEFALPDLKVYCLLNRKGNVFILVDKFLPFSFI